MELPVILVSLLFLACPAIGTDSFRSDNRCGGNWIAPNGAVAGCDPDGIYPCCSPYEWCGITPDHCDCADCIDYRGTGTASFRYDNRCGGNWIAPNGRVAECDPTGIYPCCSPHEWCGNTPDHCDCADCTDYSGDKSFRADHRCGGTWLAPNGLVAGCDPDGIYPCCSPYEWCGHTAAHCDCNGCINYGESGSLGEK